MYSTKIHPPVNVENELSETPTQNRMEVAETEITNE